MIFSNSFMRRRADVDLEEYRAHWLEPHGPMTAKLPGTKRYAQNHVMFSDGTNAKARELRIDGFAQLAYDSIDDRSAAYGSPELKACDLDSPLFIGGVSRVVTKVSEGQIEQEDSLAKAFIVVAREAGTPAANDPALSPSAVMGQLEGIRKFRTHEILQQAAAPGSAVPFLGLDADMLLELWFDNEADMLKATAKASTLSPKLATFDVRVYRFL